MKKFHRPKGATNAAKAARRSTPKQSAMPIHEASKAVAVLPAPPSLPTSPIAHTPAESVTSIVSVIPEIAAPASPFALHELSLAQYPEVPQRWLWPGRVPLGAITLLDGDLSCGKSLLSQQIAAHVSAGTPLPDGSPTIQGGVIIIAPYEDARKSILTRLKANGADLMHVYELSFVPDPPEHPNSSTKGTSEPKATQPFCLSDHLPYLREMMQKINAKLVIMDPFMALLPDDKRVYQSQIQQILLQLQHMMIELDASCLLIRQCPARGGSARPTALERSIHFSNIAASQLLLARDPLEPGRFLLSQATCRIQALSPTISFTVETQPAKPQEPHIYCGPEHPLQARDLLTRSPGALHLMLLTQHLHLLVATSAEPVPLATLRQQCPGSATSTQIQRALRDLVLCGMLTRPTRGCYTVPQTMAG